MKQNEKHRQLLYFTSPSLSEDGRYLFYIGEENNCPNLYVYDRESRTDLKLTSNSGEEMKSYVYFWGAEGKGLGKASVSLDSRRNHLFYIQDNQICMAQPDGTIRILNHIPREQMTAFTHVSSDGELLCVPTVDARALEISPEAAAVKEIGYDIDRRVQEEGLSSYIRIFSTHTGEELACERVRGAWITHVQFSPVDNSLILYNHEYCAQPGIRRMWIWNGKEHIRLRREDEKRKKEDWTCHEMWQPDGQYIIYHGKYADGRGYIGRVSPDGSKWTEIPFQEEFTQYGHFTVAQGNNSLLVSDGYYRENDSGAWAGEFISLLRTDWENGALNWTPLCRHGSSWRNQDCHPHPVFGEKDRCVYFTTDENGKREIYRVAADGGDCDGTKQLTVKNIFG
ncbi:oligogalacturonate lyase family protein [Eisenbergiella sp.]